MQGQVNPNKLTNAEATWLVNSTKYGTVADSATVSQHKSEGGVKVSPDGKAINLFGYFAWLLNRRHNVAPAKTYEEIKAAALKRDKDRSYDGRNLYPIPEDEDLEEKELCRTDFKRFCEHYFHDVFSLPWSADHLKVIEKIEKAVITGGLFAQAMPRGSGKTTLAETAAIWALVYGHRHFVVLICSDAGLALVLLDSIRAEFENNDKLYASFKKICHPIRKLEGVSLRANAQHCTPPGESMRLTNLEWTGKSLVFPTIEDSPAAGSTIQVAGLTGQIRGMKHKTAAGTAIRPDFVLIDDAQTDESSKSLSQCDSRERILAGAILGLAGPGKKISGIMPCTVIRPGDLADRILDQDKHPEWQGERMKMVYAFPKNEKLWDEYAEIRADALREDGNIQRATEFYREHQTEMDEGAVVAWPARYNPDEISALQHAMNLKFRDEIAFWAEYQNEPLQDTLGTEEIMTVDEICQKLSGLNRGEIPIQCDVITSFIDVNGSLLYYVTVAWDQKFSGFVIDYGTYPDQARRWFSLADARPTLKKIHGDSLEASIYAGLEALAGQLCGREYQRDDGALLKLSKCAIDANWGASTETVYQFCRQSPHAAVLLPSHGRYVGAASPAFSEYKKKPGDRVGLNYRIPRAVGKAVRHVVYDTNAWKTFVHARLSVPTGAPGCLSLFGREPAVHQLFAEHLTAEFRTKTEGRGRVVDEWRMRPSIYDNHFFDCLTGAAMAAAVCGVSMDAIVQIVDSRTATRISERSEKMQATPRVRLSGVLEQKKTTATGSPSAAKTKLSDLLAQRKKEKSYGR